MALKLALVIDGDAAGAKKAVEDTASAIDDLAGKASKAGEALKDVTVKQGKDENPWGDLGKGLDDIGRKGPPAADALDQVGEGLGKTNSEAPGATAGIVQVGTAAEGVGGKLAGLKSLAGTIVGGLVGGLTAAAVSSLFTALVTGIVNYATTVGERMPTLNEDLKAHTALIKAIKGAYAEAKDGASSYGNASATLLRFQAQQNVARLRDDLSSGAPSISSAQPYRDLTTGQQITPGGTVAFGFNANQLKPFMTAVDQLRQDLKDGKADYIAFRNEIAQTAAQLPADSPFRKVAESLLDQTEKLSKAQEELQRAVDLYKGLTGDADAAARALGGSADKFQQVNDTVSGGLDFLREYDQLLKSISGGAPGTPAVPDTGPQIVNNYQPFAAGGWTGPGPVGAPAGVVHGQEYVFDAASTAAIGVANLDAMRRGIRGYASGGFVGVTSATAAGSGSAVRGLNHDFTVLRGSLSTFVRDLEHTHSAMGALAVTLRSVSDRFLNFSLRLLDKAVFGSGSNDFGIMGKLIGGITGGFSGGLSDFTQIQLSSVAGGLYHSGGTVGRGAPQMRSVPAAAFLGAPRLHTGGWLKPGERPVIAMEGEEIGWPDQLAAKYGGGVAVNNFYVSTPDPKAFSESRATVARAAGRMIGRLGRYT